MNTPLAVLALIVGLALLVFGSDWLVKGAARLAARLGMSPFAIGVTVVAFGTSSPELFASVRATLSGVSDLAVGNVVGSNIANVCLILGATSLIKPVRVEKAVMRVELPVMLAITAGAVVTLLDGVVTRAEGIVLANALVGYVIFAYKVGKADPELSKEIAQEGSAESAEDPGAPLWRDGILILAGLVGLAAGAWLLVEGARFIAEQVLGVAPGIVGLTIVAFGTSLPELAASLRAVAGRQEDLAVGNIVGSNVFNLLCVMGISATVHPLASPPIWHAGVMLATGALCYPVLSKNRRISRLQGLAMLGTYLGYVVVAYLA